MTHGGGANQRWATPAGGGNRRPDAPRRRPRKGCPRGAFRRFAHRLLKVYIARLMPPHRP
eukprot:CAMPEP_0171266194 /NCGR_PEP_ID=MMETSP0790-20130122/58516_1 /TAXON_ID=2925 /ORGANISM="Alexandrium catenella, Strain OF101" /LENGTH=59 /DNA_ID=CAMNT_0011734889 /DNA_START=11 /DNA_END=187 /DNA_ORIENTATION=-